MVIGKTVAIRATVPMAGRAYEGVGRGSEAATALQEPTRGSAESGAADGTDAANHRQQFDQPFGDRINGSVVGLSAAEEKSSNFIQKAPPLMIKERPASSYITRKPAFFCL